MVYIYIYLHEKIILYQVGKPKENGKNINIKTVSKTKQKKLTLIKNEFECLHLTLDHCIHASFNKQQELYYAIILYLKNNYRKSFNKRPGHFF